ncbi:MAG TPA: cytochrome c [Novosphingobium sp.]
MKLNRIILLAALTLPVAAVAAGPNVYKARHDNFEAMGRAMKGTADQFKSGTPDLTVIKANANTLAMAAPKVAGYFPKGTGAEGNPKSEALPVIWQKPADFAAANKKLVDAAKAYQAAAATGDLDQIKAAFGTLGGACKNCHDTFRKPRT